MRTLVVSHAGKFQAELPHDAIDVALKAPNTILWLDITDPTPEDQSLLLEEFGFHPLAIEDAVPRMNAPRSMPMACPGTMMAMACRTRRRAATAV